MKLQPDSFVAGEVDDRRRRPERRDYPRRKILKIGKTFWPNGDSSECIVHNLSETGAQLEIRGPIPNVFDLAVEGDRGRRSCTVVWRKTDRIGVRFCDQPRQPHANKTTNLLVECKRYAEKCQEAAKQAAPSDRELLLEMAEMWMKVLRRLRRKAGE